MPCSPTPTRRTCPGRTVEQDLRPPPLRPNSASWGLRRALPPVGPGGFDSRWASWAEACGRLPLPLPRLARKRQPRPDGLWAVGEGSWERAWLPTEVEAGRSVAEEAGEGNRSEGAGAGGRGPHWQDRPSRCWRPNRSSLPSSTASHAANLRLSPDPDVLPRPLQTFQNVRISLRYRGSVALGRDLFPRGRMGQSCPPNVPTWHARSILWPILPGVCARSAVVLWCRALTARPPIGYWRGFAATAAALCAPSAGVLAADRAGRRPCGPAWRSIRTCPPSGPTSPPRVRAWLARRWSPPS